MLTTIVPSGRDGRARPASAGRAPSTPRSEVEVADVVGVEHIRVAEEDGPVLADGEGAQLAAVELVALFARDVTLDEGLRGERREVAQVFRVPQRERGDGAVFDEVAHLVRRSETG